MNAFPAAIRSAAPMRGTWRAIVGMLLRRTSAAWALRARPRKAIVRAQAAVLGMLVITLLATVGGCTLFAPKFSSPTLSVVSIGTVAADMFSQQFRVRVHVENPNDRVLAVKSIEYSLYLQEDRFAEGTSTESFVIPALGETEFDMTVQTSFISSIARLLAKMDPSGRVDYDLTGKVHLEKGFLTTIPFHQQGKVNLLRQGKAAK